MPTNMARNCSATSGRMMRKMSLRLKISPSGGFSSETPPPKQKLRLKLILLFWGKSVKKGKGLRSALRRQRLFRHGFPVQEYSIKKRAVVFRQNSQKWKIGKKKLTCEEEMT